MRHFFALALALTVAGCGILLGRGNDPLRDTAVLELENQSPVRVSVTIFQRVTDEGSYMLGPWQNRRLKLRARRTGGGDKHGVARFRFVLRSDEISGLFMTPHAEARTDEVVHVLIRKPLTDTEVQVR